MENKSMKPANYAQIMYALKSDEKYIGEILKLVGSIMDKLTDLRVKLNEQPLLKTFAALLYRICTIFFGRQTLGEERAGIIPVKKDEGTPISLRDSTIIACIEFAVPYIMEKIKDLALFILKKIYPDKLYAKLMDVLEKCSRIPNVIKSAFNIYIAICPLSGAAPEIFMVLDSCGYITTKPWLKSNGGKYNHVLGFIQLLSASFDFVKEMIKLIENWQNSRKTATPKAINISQDICAICMSSSEYKSVVPCGHIYCWDCILKPSREKQCCPACKKAFHSSQASLLQNY